jgi:post-segregation antitoxin (ccd killing protein)
VIHSRDLLGVSLDYLLGQPKETKKERQPDDAIKQDLLLIAEARPLGVDLRSVLAGARQQRWIEENRGALSYANAFLARHSLWSDGKRQS